jgi:hypothetical protein
MAACRSVRGLLLILTAVACFAQSTPQHSQKAAAAPDKVSLNEVSTVQVPSLPAESIGAPLFCDPDGRILFRLARPDTGVGDPVSVSKDGKTVVRFGKEKIYDIPRPVLLNEFLVGSDVYILASGSTPLGYETKWRKPNGEVVSQPATKSSTFVAHFEGDGRYAGAVRLDVPFRPSELGVFGDGSFLITGIDALSAEPRVAIVSSDGQLRRFVELKGDVHAQKDSEISGKERDPTALPPMARGVDFVKSLVGVVSGSQIAKDGPNLLLFRPLNGPIFSISPSGEARAHKLRTGGSYNLFTIKATRNAWIVELITDVPPDKPAEFATYAFDPESGAPLREYSFATNLGWGLACADGDEFTFVMADPEKNNLKFVTLAPTKP